MLESVARSGPDVVKRRVGAARAATGRRHKATRELERITLPHASLAELSFKPLFAKAVIDALCLASELLKQ